jgi:hypothetical protein
MFRSIRAIALVAVLAAVVVAAPAAQAGDKQLKVKGGKTALKISPGAAGALDSLGVAASPIGSADACGARFKFPITGGRLNAETLAGQIRHSGGIRLSAGSTHLDLRRFHINIDSKPNLTAKVGDARVSILRLDLSEAEVRKGEHRVVVKNVVARLTATAATALNDTFNVDAFTRGLKLGVAKVRARVTERHHH